MRDEASPQRGVAPRWPFTKPPLIDLSEEDGAETNLACLLYGREERTDGRRLIVSVERR